MTQVQHFFPDWKIFVFGVDVTEDVVSCVVNHGGSSTQAPSVAEFELVNGGIRGGQVTSSEDRYIITEEDLKTLYRGVFEDFQKGLTLPSEKEIEPTLAPGELTPPDADDINEADLPDIETARQILGSDIIRLSPDGARREAYRRSFPANRLREITNEARSEAIKKRAANLQKATFDRLNESAPQIRDEVKRRVLTRKVGIRQNLEFKTNLVDPPNGPQSVGKLAEITGQAARYPLQVGDCIFHTNDPVRIFWRDPKNPSRWYHMFCGFVSDFTDAVDVNNTQIVRIRCEDASRILRYARITTNPGILDINDAAVSVDEVTRTFTNDGFTGLTLSEFLFTLIFGADLGRTSGKTGTNNLRRVRTYTNTRIGINGPDVITTGSTDAIGSFNAAQSFVGVFGVDSEAAAQAEAASSNGRFRSLPLPDLGTYQALVDHQVFASDLDNLSVKESPDALLEVERIKQRIITRIDGSAVIEDVVKAIGENPQLFPVDYGRLIMLAPASLGPETNRDWLLRDIIGVNAQTEWRSRLQMIYDVMNRIDFQFYVSPRGDLLCEMPLYDFEPRDFGTTEIDLGQFLSNVDNTLFRNNDQFSLPFDANLSFQNSLSSSLDFRLSPSTLDSQVAAGLSRSPPTLLTDRAGTLYYVGAESRRGPYAPQYTIAKSHTISWDRTFSDEAVRTQMLGVHSLIPGFKDLPTSDAVAQIKPVNLYGLMPQFGVRSEKIDPMGLITDENAARLYAGIQLNKINAAARTAAVEILPRVQLCFPNRPLEFAERAFIGTIDTASHTLTWGMGGDMTTRIDVRSIRAWSGLSQNGQLVYEPIGGFASSNLNYAIANGFKNVTRENTRPAEEDT